MSVEVIFAPKDPADTVPAEFDVKNYLRKALSETIEEATWKETPGLTVGPTTVDGTVCRTVISGGAVGETYVVTLYFRTNLGLEYERSFEISVEER